MKRCVFLWVLVLCFLIGAMGQAVAQISKLKSKKIANKSGFVLLDSGLVVPGSLHILNGADVPLGFSQRLHGFMLPTGLVGDSVTLVYEVLNIPSRVFIRDVRKYKEGVYFFDEPDIKAFPQAREELFSTPGISKTGTLSRGISFGNTQSVFVNSQLNLQMQGQLSKDLRLTAVISDQAVPFQPEGNTQTLREFDKVYIQLDHAKYGRLLAGDVVLQNAGDAFFLKYYKNVQGAQVSLSVIDTVRNGLTTGAFAVAKGKFASVVIPALEGIQGPYSIRSPDLGTNVIITANSERVYLDGRIMRRGYNQDYTIDYNTGEITFTNTVLITRYTRIRIDFEYIAQDYSRSIYQVGHREDVTKSTTIALNHYQEQDDREKPFGFTPTQAIIEQLGAAADTLNKAFIPGYSRVYSFTTGQILYTKVVPFDGLGDSVFVQISEAKPSMFSVSFTATAKGDYDLIPGATNGKIYKYVGRGRGSYLPIRPVTLPNKKSVSTISVFQKIGKRQTINAEAAFGQSKLNLYSSDAKADRNGQAGRLTYQLKDLPAFASYKWSAGSQVEYITSKFRGIDRYRPIEFDRDWGAYGGDSSLANDLYVNAVSTFQKNSNDFLKTRMALRDKGDNVKGRVIDLAGSKVLGRFRLNGLVYDMQSRSLVRRSSWKKWGAGATYSIKNIETGYQYLEEQSSIYRGDSVVSTTNDYRQHMVSVSSADTGRFVPHITYVHREDRLPLNGKLVQATTSETFNAQNTLKSMAGNTLSVTVTARSLRYNNTDQFPESSTDATANTLMGRVDWLGTYFQKCVRNEFTFASNNGRELQREYRFIQTPIAGEGTHYYLGDLNQNGIQDLEEFVEATRPEQKLYIKIFVPTNTYIRAYSSNINYRLSLQAPIAWRTKGRFLSFVSKLSHLSTLVADHRTTSAQIGDRLNPINFSGGNSLGGNRQIRSSTFLNRADPNYGGEFSFTSTESRQLVANGFERRFSEEYKLQGRKNLSSITTLSILTVYGNKGAASDYLANRNYKIESKQVGTELAFQPRNTIRIGAFANLNVKNNTLGAEKAQQMKLGSDFRLSQASLRTVNAGITFTRILFQNGEVDSPLAYDMLEALSPGNNLTWNVNFQQKLASGLQLLLSYDGRKSGVQDAVHLGKVQLTALF